MISMIINETFEAAHRLRFHPGKCKNLHGHNYKVEIDLGTKDNGWREHSTSYWKNKELPFLMDFGDLKKKVKPILDILDHSTILHKNDPLYKILLREFPELKIVSLDNEPTAEILAMWIYDMLLPYLPRDIELFVSVEETEGCSATYTE